MSDMEAKRAANIKAKEEKKKAEVDAIKAKKLEKQAEREKSTAEGKQKEEADAKAKEELNQKREANIASKDKSRAVKNAQKKGGSSKYSKKDVYELQAVFNEYDKDGSGKVTMTEFGDALKNKKNKNAPRPGEKSTLAQRQANEGISILDLSESVFHEMDTDGDGEVTFRELLKLMFPLARPEELDTMMQWVEPEPEPEPEPKPELSAEAKKAINKIFKLYDKDKSGSLTVQELKKALEKTGIDPDEIKTMFHEYDLDESGAIEISEFMQLMESTGAFDDM